MFLNQIGLDFGPSEDFLSQDRWNADGYCENLDALILNDRILLGDRFYRENRWRQPTDKRSTSDLAIMQLLKLRYFLDINPQRALQRGREKAAEIEAFTTHFKGDTVKDPRFCFTLRGWSEVTEIESVLFVYRSPEEIVKSIQKRERLPRCLAYQLWRRHIESFLIISKHVPTHFVSFNDFFDPQNQILAMQSCFDFAQKPYHTDDARNALNSVMNPDLKHYNDQSERQYAPKTQRLIQQLQALKHP